jgi:hypothetical protein
MDADIKCKECGNTEFELGFSGMNKLNNFKRSIIATCKCGRRIEYRGVEEAIDMTPWNKKIN